MASIDKFNGNFGNVNGFVFGKKVENEDTQKTVANQDVPVGQTSNTEKVGNKDLNLNFDPKAIYSSMGLSLSKNTSTEANMEKFFLETPQMYTLKTEFKMPAEIDGLDEDFAPFLSAKALAFTAKMTPQQMDRIAFNTIHGEQNLDNILKYA